MWDLEVETFNVIPTPRKRLLVVPQTSHHDLYRDPAKLQLAAVACRDWFTTHLGGG